jgi:hypothetical protein
MLMQPLTETGRERAKRRGHVLEVLLGSPYPTDDLCLPAVSMKVNAYAYI